MQAMDELFRISLFPILLTLGCYQIGLLIQKKLKSAVCNPILISVILILAFMAITGMENGDYQAGTAKFSWLLTPATICLAIPMYQQLQVLKKHLPAIAVGVAAGAIVVFNLKKEEGPSRFSLLLILLLLASGGGDAVVKIFEALGPQALSSHFLCFSFSVAFVLCAGLVLLHKERPDSKALLYGGIIGIANFFSSKFILGALTQIPAVVVFPTYSVATMLVVTLCGVIFFRERLRKQQWLAFGAVIIALIMLNI